MKRSYSGSWLTAGSSLPEFSLRAEPRLRYKNASAPGNNRAGSGGACFRSWTARITAAAIATTARTMGKVRLIRMECGQGCHDNTVGRYLEPLGRNLQRSNTELFLQLCRPVRDQLEWDLGLFFGVVHQQTLSIGGDVERNADAGRSGVE